LHFLGNNFLTRKKLQKPINLNKKIDKEKIKFSCRTTFENNWIELSRRENFIPYKYLIFPNFIDIYNF